MIERLGPVPGSKKAAAQAAFKKACEEHLKLLRTFEALRVPVARFLMETGVCAENTRMPLGDDLLAALRRANGKTGAGAHPGSADAAGAGGANGAGSSQPA